MEAKMLMAGTTRPRILVNLIGFNSPANVPFSSQNPVIRAKLVRARLLNPKQLKGMLSARVGNFGKFKEAVVRAEK
jgi:hypothetical protein